MRSTTWLENRMQAAISRWKQKCTPQKNLVPKDLSFSRERLAFRDDKQNLISIKKQKKNKNKQKTTITFLTRKIVFLLFSFEKPVRANHGQHMVDRGKASVGMGKRRALRETVHLSAFGSLQLVYSIKTVPYVPCKYLLGDNKRGKTREDWMLGI